MKMLRILSAALVLSIGFATAALAQSHLRLVLREDADALDPTTARTYVGRIVFAALCDKLFDIDENLRIVPQLATGFEWGDNNLSLTLRLRPNVVFHDGERMDAEAVKFSLERHLNMQGSFRRTEISVVQSVEVVDPLTVRLRLSSPFAPLIAQFTDRAGMIVSPKAARELGANFGNRPVCAGPFRFVERVAQDRIVVERFPQYWNASQIHLDRVTYRIITDGAVRLANLQSGDVDFIEFLVPTDLPAVRRNNRLRVTNVPQLGYQGLTINIGNGERARAPIGANAKVREAFELAIDRNIINQVVFSGEFIPGNQWVAPESPFYQRSLPMPARDVNRARALLREANMPNPVVNLLVPNAPETRQIGEIIQSMTREAGFDVRIQAMEFAASLNAAERGEFEVYLIGWSGRADPDGNIYSFSSCRGPLNNSKICREDLDRLLNESRTQTDQERRMAVYEQAARILLQDRPIIYLYHPRNVHAFSARVQGFTPNPDGLVRLQGVRIAAN